MIVAYGSTRFVFSVGDVVIKIARIRPFRWVSRFFYWKGNGGVTQKLQTINQSRTLAILYYFFNGVLANLEEYRFYNRYPNKQIAPTFFSFFGLVNIQAKGTPIKRYDLPNCPFREFAGTEIDLSNVQHFGWIEGRICLLDYGNGQVNNLLVGSSPEKVMSLSYN